MLPLRGNLDTRLGKLDRGEYDAIVLAAAGLKRLGLADRIREILPPTSSLPAPGQGALGIEARQEASECHQVLNLCNDPATSFCVHAERAVMLAVEGNCRMPVAAHAIRENGKLRLAALLADADGSNLRRAERTMAWPEVLGPAQLLEAAALGRDLGQELRALRS